MLGMENCTLHVFFWEGGVKIIISHYSATKMVELTAVQSKVQ